MDPMAEGPAVRGVEEKRFEEFCRRRALAKLLKPYSLLSFSFFLGKGELLGNGDAVRYYAHLVILLAIPWGNRVRLTSKADLVRQEEDEATEHRHIQEEQNA